MLCDFKIYKKQKNWDIKISSYGSSFKGFDFYPGFRIALMSGVVQMSDPPHIMDKIACRALVDQGIFLSTLKIIKKIKPGRPNQVLACLDP